MTLEQVGSIARELLPVFGILVLIALLVVLIKVVGILSGLTKTLGKANALVDNLNTTVDGVNKAIDTTNGYLTDLQITVRTVNNVALGIDAIRIAIARNVKKTQDKMTAYLEAIKEMISDILDKKDKESPVQPVSEVVTNEKDGE